MKEGQGRLPEEFVLLKTLQGKILIGRNEHQWITNPAFTGN